MTKFNYPLYESGTGYMTESVRKRYIDHAIEAKILPTNAHDLSQVLSLVAPTDPAVPIQFWQLHSVLGIGGIVDIVARFYEKVFADETWFVSVFERVASKSRHINTQAAMWVDVMGGGPQYHGGEFRFNFHHTHNAAQLMNSKGAKRWSELMKATLDETDWASIGDPRVRTSINTFLNFFMSKYAEDFQFDNEFEFGEKICA